MRCKNKGIWAVAMAAVLIVGCQKVDVVATVGDVDITKTDFDAYLSYKRILSEDPSVQSRALDELIARESLAQAIAEQELLSSAEIAAELAEMRRQALISRYFDKYLEARITDDMVRAFYANNISDYEARRAKVAHILIRTNARMGEPERAAKLTLAREIYSKLNSGEDFAQLASTYSEDQVSGKKGGDLGWLSEGAVSPEFSDKAFTLEIGHYTEPFMTAYGYHIVKLLEGPQISRKPVEAVESQIRYQLRKEAKQAEIKRLQASVSVRRMTDAL